MAVWDIYKLFSAPLHHLIKDIDGKYARSHEHLFKNLIKSGNSSTGKNTVGLITTRDEQVSFHIPLEHFLGCIQLSIVSLSEKKRMITMTHILSLKACADEDPYNLEHQS